MIYWIFHVHALFKEEKKGENEWCNDNITSNKNDDDIWWREIIIILFKK
jgi:hypothetical protein